MMAENLPKKVKSNNKEGCDDCHIINNSNKKPQTVSIMQKLFQLGTVCQPKNLTDDSYL